MMVSMLHTMIQMQMRQIQNRIWWHVVAARVLAAARTSYRRTDVKTSMRNLLAGLIASLAGSAAGLVTMAVIMKLASRISMLEGGTRDPYATLEERSMSLVGVQHKDGDSATFALARIILRKKNGREPSTRKVRRLSTIIHYAYGIAVGIAYGMLRRRATRGSDAVAGVIYGTGLWALGDELAVPLLGLGDKPTAYRAGLHAKTLLAHIGYGVALAVTTGAAERRLLR